MAAAGMFPDMPAVATTRAPLIVNGTSPSKT
jgi:hypothetical protein